MVQLAANHDKGPHCRESPFMQWLVVGNRLPLIENVRHTRVDTCMLRSDSDVIANAGVSVIRTAYSNVAQPFLGNAMHPCTM